MIRLIESTEVTVEKMNVLFITDVYEIGGAFKAFKEMITALSEEHDVTPIVIVPDKGAISDFCKTRNIRCIVTGHRQFYVNAGSTAIRRAIRFILRPYLFFRYRIANCKALKIVDRELDMSQIDIIHTNTERNDIGACLSVKYNIPHLWHLRAFGDLDYSCFSLRPNYIEFMNRGTTMFAAISKCEAAHWIERGINKEKVQVIYDGVDSCVFRPGDSTQRSKDHVRIIMTGFISSFKGQIQLIEAISLLEREYRKKLSVDIYGHGAFEYVRKLKKTVSGYGLEGVITFNGYNTNIHELLPSYDIGVTCSKAEAFGRVTVEDMLCGLCVIASDKGANPELVTNGQTGMLYEYGNARDLADSIRYLIDNPDRRDTMARSAEQYARQNFSKENNAHAIYEKYCELTT